MVSFSNSNNIAASGGMPSSPPRSRRNDNPDVNNLRLRRASRQNTQRDRGRYANLVKELEARVKTLKADLDICHITIRELDRQGLQLILENASLKQKLDRRTYEMGSEEALFEVLKKERDELKQLIMQQQQQREEEMTLMMRNMADGEFGPQKNYQL